MGSGPTVRQKAEKFTLQRGTSKPRSSKSLDVMASEGRSVKNGKIEFGKGSRPTILVPDRKMAGTWGVRIILDNGDELWILRFHAVPKARQRIDRILDEKYPFRDRNSTH